MLTLDLLEASTLYGVSSLLEVRIANVNGAHEEFVERPANIELAPESFTGNDALPVNFVNGFIETRSCR